MAKLTKAERADLEAKLAADDQDDDDDYEIEIRDGDKATRIPYSKGRSWLQQNFGIDLDPAADDDEPAEKPKLVKDEPKVVPAHFRSRRSG